MIDEAFTYLVTLAKNPAFWVIWLVGNFLYGFSKAAGRDLIQYLFH